MKWIVVKDHLAEEGESSDVGVHSRAGIPADRSRKGVGYWEAGYVCHARMYDDDGEHYYTVRVEFTSDDDSGFEPLDHFGMPNAGCTAIKYRNPDGTWAIL